MRMVPELALSAGLPACTPTLTLPARLDRRRARSGGRRRGAGVADTSAPVALDEIPDDTQHRSHASFPWSHQPLTRWFDFDTHTLTSIFHIGKHCEIVLVLILPGFDCVLGHLDDEARGDLLDPALLPGPLQLPAPAIPVRQPPWSVTARDAASSAVGAVMP